LLRRVIFTVVDITLVILPSFKYMIFTFIHLLSLVIHIMVQPYATVVYNRIELMTLISLTILSLILTAFPDASTISGYDSVQVLITASVIVPIVIFAMFAVYRWRSSAAAGKNGNNDDDGRDGYMYHAAADVDDADDHSNNNNNVITDDSKVLINDS
jgi:hypothetical protein